MVLRIGDSGLDESPERGVGQDRGQMCGGPKYEGVVSSSTGSFQSGVFPMPVNSLNAQCTQVSLPSPSPITLPNSLTLSSTNSTCLSISLTPSSTSSTLPLRLPISYSNLAPNVSRSLIASWRCKR